MIGIQLTCPFQERDRFGHPVLPLERQGKIVEVEIVLRIQLDRFFVVRDGPFVVADSKVAVAKEAPRRGDAGIQGDRLLDQWNGDRGAVRLRLRQREHQAEIDGGRQSFHRAAQQVDRLIESALLKQPASESYVVFRLCGRELDGSADFLDSGLLTVAVVLLQQQAPKAVAHRRLIRFHPDGLPQRFNRDFAALRGRVREPESVEDTPGPALA